MPLLSVIVPVYNQESFLPQCLESIISQSFKNIEIICVDDGSTDNSLKILEEYAKKDVRIIVLSQKHQGAATARNVGLNIAKADFITFVDSDDFIDKNTYDYAMKFTQFADLVCFGIQVFGDFGLEYRTDDNKYYKIKYSGLKKISDKIILRTDVSLCNKILKKSIILQNNITFLDGFLFEDADFFCKYVSCIKNIFFIDKYFYHYRRVDNTIMAKTFKCENNAIHHIYILRDIFEFWKNNGFLHTHTKLFSKIFENFLKIAYSYSSKIEKDNVLNLANDFACSFDNIYPLNSHFIHCIKTKQYNRAFKPKLKFYQKIFKKYKFFNLDKEIYEKEFFLFGLKFQR